jgi:hypothetical protein
MSANEVVGPRVSTICCLFVAAKGMLTRDLGSTGARDAIL